MSAKPTSFSMADVIAAAGPDHNLKAALHFVLDHEGMVLEDVPGDPGGSTCCGITYMDYDAYRHEHHLTPQSLSKITATEVAGCYREHYWQPCQCAKVPYPVAVSLFDSGVLCGNVRGIRWMQTELNVAVDGAMGQNTLAAVGVYVQKHGALQLAKAVLSQRRVFHQHIVDANPSLKKFLQGWLNRVDDLEKEIAKV